MKVLLWIVGGCAALFVAAVLVLAALDLAGAVNLEEQDKQSTKAQARDEKAGDGERSDKADRKRKPASRWPLTRVTRVIDGDTVEADKLGRVRLIGVDTPEEGRCYSTAATAFTKRRLGGQTVGYELGAERKDRFGRTLAYLYRGETMHDLDLVRHGYAKVLTIPPNDKYAAQLQLAARRAKGTKQGVWGICERRIQRARAHRRAVRARAARERRQLRERRRLERERRERERQLPPPPSNPAPSNPSDGGGGGGGGNVPGIPGI